MAVPDPAMAITRARPEGGAAARFESCSTAEKEVLQFRAKMQDSHYRHELVCFALVRHCWVCLTLSSLHAPLTAPPPREVAPPLLAPVPAATRPMRRSGTTR
ncbi:hypothetical protein PR202_gb23066 [Eleusine coracana subsp. coracana]|uniref:Uncharacterized protein n=1 Tax=Eleusine coracana subsp. coracana TaxID=191504 RepID=A0AAV5FJD3_ELECO|nr:hypothetical protein PR202_gb23066 [Eleusine coracana subsp. coracana]